MIRLIDKIPHKVTLACSGGIDSMVLKAIPSNRTTIRKNSLNFMQNEYILFV